QWHLLQVPELRELHGLLLGVPPRLTSTGGGSRAPRSAAFSWPSRERWRLLPCPLGSRDAPPSPRENLRVGGPPTYGRKGLEAGVRHLDRRDRDPRVCGGAAAGGAAGA